MAVIVVERLRERIAASGMSQFELAESVGLSRGYFNAALKGKKKTFQAYIAKVEKALQCDYAYILGLQDTLKANRPIGKTPGISIKGVAEINEWRRNSSPKDYPTDMLVSPDARFDLDQAAYVMRPAPPGFTCLAITIDIASFEASMRVKDGALLLVERSRSGSKETGIWTLLASGNRLEPFGQEVSTPIIQSNKKWPRGTKIIAVVTCITLLRNLNYNPPSKKN